MIWSMRNRSKKKLGLDLESTKRKMFSQKERKEMLDDQMIIKILEYKLYLIFYEFFFEFL